MIEYIKLALFFVSGIYLSERIASGFALIFIISLIMVLTIKAFFKHKFDTKILIMMLVMVFGVLICRFSADINLRDLSDYTGKYVTLTGRIAEIPVKDDDNIRYEVDVKKLSYRDGEKRIYEKILLTSDKKFEYGDTVTFKGMPETLPVKMNDNSMDYALYCKGRNIFFKMYSSDINTAEYALRDYSPYAAGVAFRDFVSNIIEENYKGDYAAILKAVLTGNKKEFSEEFDDILTRTGAKRFFYPAFLHVMLFMSLVSFVLGAVGRRLRDPITAVLLILYAMFNLSGVTFVKLCVMLSLFILWKHFFGKVYYPDILGMTAIIMGIVSPLVYFHAGFVMSMLSSVLIYYFYDITDSKLKFIKIRYLRRSVAVGIICTAGLIPVSAYFFNYVSWYSIPLSVIMLPCVTVILLLSPLLITLLALFRCAPVIRQAVSCMMFIMKYVPVMIDKLPFTGSIMAKPGILFLIIYLLITVASVKYIKNKKRHMYAALFAAAALTVSASAIELSRLDDVEITFVNVGQGDGALISAPHRFNVLIDGGGGNAYSDYDPGKKIYLEYLKSSGIIKVDSAFVSHYHKDHVQGIIAAIENIRVRNLFLPDVMEGCEWRAALEEAADKNGTEVHYISRETLLTYNNGMTIRVVPPAEKTKFSRDENDTSYVCYVEYGGFKTVFTGDMSEFAEKCLIDAGKAEKADLLKVAHHGSKTSTGSEWIEAVEPKYAVISVGEDNTYSLPSDKTLKNLSGIEVYRTDYDGDIRFIVDKSGKTEIETFNRR